LNGLFKRELDIAQEIRVNQYKTASSMLIYSCLGRSCLVVFVYSELSSGSIQPPSVANCSYRTSQNKSKDRRGLSKWLGGSSRGGKGGGRNIDSNSQDN